MKISLIHGKYFNSWEALGLGYIAAYLKKNRPDLQLDFFQGYFDDEARIVKTAAESDLVGFSATTPTIAYCSSLAKRIKEVNSRIRTVIGGYHPSAAPQSCMPPEFDHVVVGEGEAAFLDLIRGERRPLVYGRPMDFSELPWPDRVLIRNERNIEVAFQDNKKRITSFSSHRGCPFMCKYCLDGHNKVLYANDSRPPIRYRPVGDLLDEIEAVAKAYSLDFIKFSDPTWNTNIDWVLEYCREKIRRQNSIPFYPNMHAGVCSEEMLLSMAKAGCQQVALGVESGSPKILKQIGKGTTVESIRRFVLWAKAAGIRIRGYFILGMPDESADDIGMTEQFAAELDLDEYGFSLLCPYPGTEMYDPISHGRIDWAKADEYSNDFWATKHLTNGELKTQQKRLTTRFGKKLTWHNRAVGHG